MSGKIYKVGFLAAFLILALGRGVSPVAARGQSAKGPGGADPRDEKVVNFIRERFVGISGTDKFTVGAWHPSAVASGFEESTVTADDGKNRRTQTILVSKDMRYLILVIGNIVDLPQATQAEMVQRFQEAFKTPPTLKLSFGGFKPSVSPDFEQGTLTMQEAGRPKQDRVVLLTRDHKHMILSEIYNMGIDRRLLALHTISLHDEPSIGPSTAPVTLVEYADLQCPMCARMHEFLETKVAPRYGNQVRIVFKEFPLVNIHDWSYTAAIADQCAYEMNPAAYVPLRTAIYRNQQMINITNLRDTLLNLGEQAGVDRVKLAACIDAKSSKPRIDRDMAEAKRLDVAQTPTVFINGRLMVGLPSEDAYYHAIDEALRGAK